MKVFTLLFISFLCVECNLNLLKSLETVNDNEGMIPIEIVTNYLYKYFYQRQVYFMIAFMSTTPEQKHFQEDLITKLMRGPKFGNFTFNFLDKVDQIQRGNLNAFNLIFVDGVTSLKKVLNESTVQQFHLEQQFLIVITQDVDNATESLNDIFETIQKLHLIEVNVLIEEYNTSTWTLNYHMPYAKNCYSFTIHELERFTPKNYTLPLLHPYKDLFPMEFYKFPNCPLFVAVFPYQPFVIIENPANGTGETIFRGFDVKIVKEIAKTINMTPKYVYDHENRGMVYANGTATGAQGMVINGGARMTIGNYGITPERIAAMSATRSYAQTSNVFAFAESNVFVTPLARVLAPFQTWLWIAILSLLTVSITILLLTKKLTRFQRHFIIGGYRNRTPILNMFSGVIGAAVGNRRMARRRYFGVFARTLTILWIFFWLIVRNAYQGSLYGFLRSERVTSIYDTFDKVTDSDCDIFVMRNEYVPNVFDKNRIRRYDYSTFTALKKLSTGEWKGVVLTNSVSVNFFNMVSNLTRRLDYTHDRVTPTIGVFYFKKHSVLTSMFNKKIDIFNEAGLIYRWLKKYNYEAKSPKYKRAGSLTITNISAILKISAFMYLISGCVFALETLSGKYERLKKLLDYLTY